MKIPKNFKEVLERDNMLNAIVSKTFHDYECIVKTSKFEFFPEYTDHGIEHIEDVLYSAASLISNESYCYLSPKNISVLMLSILVHDLGMHITYEGFNYLISEEYSEYRIKYFDEFPWSKLWESYLYEVKRFDRKKLTYLFGNAFNIKGAPIHRDELTDYDKKVIGEFIRRHHARLSHEIAVFGFPGVNNQLLDFAKDLNETTRNIIGIIARSHGMELRATFDYLKNRFDDRIWYNPLDIQIIYLMVVLRIADYIHISSERAPNITLKLRNITSPLSKSEWELNGIIEQRTNKSADPETIFVYAEPANSKSFLKLKDLLNSIQNELDISWAVLGEIYGRNEDFNKLKLTIRRIDSNLNHFSKTANFITEKASFNVANETSKLLIKPLYGNNPSYGIRELIQNAVDACRERMIISQKRGIPYEADITLKVGKDEKYGYFLLISDNGIGMTKNILIEYFLKVGASFRNCDIWRNNFIDENGRSTVSRTGRFGIGILSAFLLGDEISVYTQHMDSDSYSGYEFTATLETEQIEIKKSFNVHKGTIVRIILNYEVYNELKKQVEYQSIECGYWYDWYKSKSPEINIRVPKDWKEIRIENLEPAEDEKIPIEWNTISRNNLYKVNWTYSQRPILTCNGIFISGYEIERHSITGLNKLPRLAVFDYGGEFPLTLDRNNLTIDKLPFEEDLAKDIFRDKLAKLLVMPNISRIDSDFLKISLHRFSYPQNQKDDDIAIKGYSEKQTEKLLFFQKGYCLMHPCVINKLKPHVLTSLYLTENPKTGICLEKNETAGFAIFYEKQNILQIHELYDGFIHEKQENGWKISKRVFFEKNQKSNRTFYRLQDMDFERKRKGRNDKWFSRIEGNPPEPNITAKFFERNAESIGFVIEYYITYDSEYKKKSGKDIFEEVLNEYLEGDFLIPYDIEERIKKYPKAFKELERYMIKYRKSNFLT